ncbi:MAG: carboxypeptidase-like regulatory domain-containing protein [candidate division WOR-3 bacterium]
MTKKILFFILISNLFLPLSIYSDDFYGYVFEEEKNEPLMFCNVYVVNKEKEILKGDLTDETGFYIIKDIPYGEYYLIVNLIGFQSETLKVYSKGEDLKVKNNFKLKIKSLVYKGSEITAERSEFKNEISISKKIYKREELKISVPLVENDIMRSFQLLPSVTASSDFSSALYVRGGAPDQNLILFDNALIFNPFHLGGLFSTFEINSIDNVTFYAGGFPSSFGNRLSSVIDMKSITPKEEKSHTVIDVSMLSSKLHFQSKVYKGFSFFVSFRRTYFDQLLKLIRFDFPYYFYDITTALNYRMNEKNNLKLSFFLDQDILDINLDTVSVADVRWGNRMVSLEHSFLLNNSSNIVSNIYYSNYKNRMDFLKLVHIHSYIYQYGGKTKFEKKFGENNFYTGFEFYRDSFDYLFTISDTGELLNFKNNPYYFSTFLNYSYKRTGFYIFDFGIRIDRYQFIRKFFPNLRGSFKYFIDQNSSFTFSVGDYYQFITSVKQETGDFSSIFGETWLPVSENFEPLRCLHYIAGYEKWFSNDLSLNFEMYYKDYKNLVYTTLMDIFYNLDDPVKGYKTTKGYSEGFEILLKKSSGNLTGWIGYSYSRVRMLKDSIYYPTYYDRTNSFILNISYLLKNGINFNLVINYGSGLPYTAVVGKYMDYTFDPITGEYYRGWWREIESDFNSARFPPYKRVDVGVSKKFKFNKFNLGLSLNIINLFNFKNVYFYYYDHSVSPSRREDFTMFPIIPTVGVQCEF